MRYYPSSSSMLEKRLLINTIQTINEGVLLSNYCIAFGKTEIINSICKLFKKFEDDDEISVVTMENDYSLLSISNSERILSIDNSLIYFKGWFQDHKSKSIILGQNGFSDWNEKNQTYPSEINFEGSYISANFQKNKLIIQNDLFSYLPVIYFSNKDLFVCSDSMYIISEIRKSLDLPCKLNKKVMHSRAWTHGLSCAVMSNDAQINDVKILSPGKHIEIEMYKKRLSSKYLLTTKNIVKSSNLKEIFAVKFESYEQAIRDATAKMSQSTISFLHLDDVMIKFGLSGGLDSRIILAAMLQNPELLERVAITTNPHPSRKGDYVVVEKLSKIYGFRFNDSEKLTIQKKKHSMKLKKIPDRFALWVLSSMGLFDMMYLRDSYWPVPYIIDMGGHGAESIKGTFSPMKFENYIKPKTISSRAKFSRKVLKHMREVKSANVVHDAIRSELSSALATSGIDLDEEASIQWHYLCYKSPIANGRFLDCSAIGIRPFIQHSLFALSISEINPFKYVKKGEPTMLHDMLILLNPELASIEFENSKANISEEYIQSRLEALGGSLKLSEIESYKIYGSINEMKNGPPESFLKMVKHDFKYDGNDIDSILGALERAWTKITDEEVKTAYTSAYEIAKERLGDPDFYPPSAGTPAAKIISLSLLD